MCWVGGGGGERAAKVIFFSRVKSGQNWPKLAGRILCLSFHYRARGGGGGGSGMGPPTISIPGMWNALPVTTGRHALEQKNIRRRYPPPAGPPPPRSNLPPPLPSYLKKIFFGANVLCVPQGHVQGVSELFTLSSMSL